jgi:penicillin-binding protein activator
MRAARTLATSFLLATLAGCGGARAFSRGEYQDPHVIELLSDQFNENDLQLIAKRMVESLSASVSFQQVTGRPLLLIGRMKNKTSEHIDMESLADMVRVHLSQQGKFAFVNKEAREQLADEYEYDKSGAVDPNKAKKPGEQVSPDYLLTGTIASIVQEVGNDKVVYYKMTMELTNLRTAVIEWTEEKELRKAFRKRSVGW